MLKNGAKREKTKQSTTQETGYRTHRGASESERERKCVEEFNESPVALSCTAGV